jgi:hypothetical protein
VKKNKRMVNIVTSISYECDALRNEDVKNVVNMSGLESKWYEVCDKVKELGARMEHPLEGRECDAQSDGWAPICLEPWAPKPRAQTAQVL